MRPQSAGWLCRIISIYALVSAAAGYFKARSGWRMLWAPLSLFLWGFLQQYMLQAFVNRRVQILWGPGTRSIMAVALIFGGLHLPNLLLVLATFVGGILWAAVYQRIPNLFALALSHSFMTTVMVWTLPQSVLHGMRVGYGYFLWG